jgi:hypothetical protein
MINLFVAEETLGLEPCHTLVSFVIYYTASSDTSDPTWQGNKVMDATKKRVQQNNFFHIKDI